MGLYPRDNSDQTFDLLQCTGLNRRDPPFPPFPPPPFPLNFKERWETADAEITPFQPTPLPPPRPPTTPRPHLRSVKESVYLSIELLIDRTSFLFKTQVGVSRVYSGESRCLSAVLIWCGSNYFTTCPKLSQSKQPTCRVTERIALTHSLLDTV